MLGVLRANNLHVPSDSEWELVRQAAEQTATLLQRDPRPVPWIGYLIVDLDAAEAVGVCGFKNAPKDGRVEIAYFTFPRFEGRGVATAAVSVLVEYARSAKPIPRITARTLREMNASSRVLRKCGFSLVGDVMDPEDGLVWEWEWSASGTTTAVNHEAP